MIGWIPIVPACMLGDIKKGELTTYTSKPLKGDVCNKFAGFTIRLMNVKLYTNLRHLLILRKFVGKEIRLQ